MFILYKVQVTALHASEVPPAQLSPSRTSRKPRLCRRSLLTNRYTVPVFGVLEFDIKSRRL